MQAGTSLGVRVGERVKSRWRGDTLALYSATEKSEIMLFAGKWKEPEIFMLREVSPAQKVEGRMFSLLGGRWKGRWLGWGIS